MKVINVAPKDIYLTLEFALEDLVLIRDALSCAEFKFSSSEDPELEKAINFTSNDFYSFLNGLIEEMKNGTGG